MQFSIIIPAYNAEKFILRSVYSVLNQTFDDYELIVINDGSRDGTLRLLESINDRRLTVIDKKNEGVSVARNVGIEKARGEFICFLDADDEYLSIHLDRLNNLIHDYPNENFFVTKFCVSSMHDQDKILEYKATGSKFVYKDVVREQLNRSKLMVTDAVCIRSKMFNLYGTFEPGMVTGEDVDMWRRIYVHTGIVFLDSVTVKVNRDGSQTTKRYTRAFEVDPLHRMERFMLDDTISNNVKESLKVNHEYVKVEVVRSYLYAGNRKAAKSIFMTVDRSLIPLKRWLITRICFIVPTPLIRGYLHRKNREVYEKGSRDV